MANIQNQDNMKDNVRGRQHAKEALDKYLHSAQSEFIAVYGRRRVGKTFLIREYLEDEIVFQFSGMAKTPNKLQLQNFAQTLSRYAGKELPEPTNWLKAFDQLITYLSSIRREGKKVVFIDELPWLDTPRSNFLPAIENFWNNWASARHDIMLVVCGSVTSWMMDNLINNHGGLYGRLTGLIPLQPFTLVECEDYFTARGLHLSRYEICEAYMIFGGIPYYLNVIDPQRSLAGSVDFALFNPNGPLYDEYSHLFPAMFHNPENYVKVIKILATKLSGMTRKEIIDCSDFHSGEGLTTVLTNLVKCGFVRLYSPYGTKRKYYQLVDFYTLFYHRFLADRQKMSATFWTAIQRTNVFYQWAGTRFELLVLHHIDQLKRFLKIEGVQTEAYSWRSLQTDDGAQIDLVLQRADNTINLCEMKFTEGSYSISKQENLRLRNRMQELRTYMPKRMSLQLTLITTYGLEEGTYSGLVNQAMTLDELFE